DGPHEQGLAQTWNAFKEYVAARDQGGERTFDDVILADNHLGDLLTEALEVGAELIEMRFDGVGVHGFHRFHSVLVRGPGRPGVTERDRGLLRSPPGLDILFEVNEGFARCQMSGCPLSYSRSRAKPGNEKTQRRHQGDIQDSDGTN